MSVQSPPRFPSVDDPGSVPAEPQPWQPRSAWVVAAAIAAAVVFVALIVVLARGHARGGSSSATIAVTTTPTTAPVTATTVAPTTTFPTSPPNPTVEAVRAQYFAFWHAFDDYGRGTGPFDPTAFKNTFGPVATGGEYTHLFDYFQTNRLKGLAFRGGRPPEEELAPTITLEDPAQATVTDCSTSSGETYDVATGAVVKPADSTPAPIVVVMRIVDGTWKVTSVATPDQPCTR